MHVGDGRSCRIRGCECDSFDTADLVAVRREDLARLLDEFVFVAGDEDDRVAHARLVAALESTR